MTELRHIHEVVEDMSKAIWNAIQTYAAEDTIEGSDEEMKELATNLGIEAITSQEFKAAMLDWDAISLESRQLFMNFIVDSPFLTVSGAIIDYIREQELARRN
jgi:hypothetical protein